MSEEIVKMQCHLDKALAKPVGISIIGMTVSVQSEAKMIDLYPCIL